MCIYIYIYTYIHTYIHTYTHICYTRMYVCIFPGHLFGRGMTGVKPKTIPYNY